MNTVSFPKPDYNSQHSQVRRGRDGKSTLETLFNHVLYFIEVLSVLSDVIDEIYLYSVVRSKKWKFIKSIIVCYCMMPCNHSVYIVQRGTINVIHVASDL